MPTSCAFRRGPLLSVAGFITRGLVTAQRVCRTSPCSLKLQPRLVQLADQPGGRSALRAYASKSTVIPATVVSETELRTGAIIEFKKDNRAVIAFVLQPDGKKNFWVVDQAGRRHSVQPRQVLFTVPGNYVPGDLARFAAVMEGLDTSLLEIVHAVTLDEGGVMDLGKLCDLLFEERQPHLLWATYKMLTQDQLYFKQVSKGPLSFSANTPAAVEAARQQLEARRLQQEERVGFLASVKAARAASARAELPTREGWLSGLHSSRVKALLEFTTQQGTATERAAALALDSLVLLGLRGEPEEAGQLLIALGVLRLHEPLQLLRRGVGMQHPREVDEAAQARLFQPPPDLDAARRVDMTHLPVFTIDSETTVEVDDGMSVEELPGGALRLWVHVADPTRWLSPSDVLDQEARKRVKTLYLPWGRVPMFPEPLATGPFSLRAGEVSDALSVGMVMSSDGTLADVLITPSRVRVTNKLAYDVADAVLGMGPEHCPHPELVILKEAATRRFQHRLLRGAINIQLPEANVSVPYIDLDAPRPHVTVSCSHQDTSASHQLVSEMMIMAGEAVGMYGARAKIALPYRGQDQPTLPCARDLEALPNDWCRGYALRRCMTRSTLKGRPQQHAGLGMDAYVQFTSPIRRYTDLIAHFQVKAHLRGEALPFGAGSIEAMAATAGERERELNAAQRECDNYWIAEHLKQRANVSWDAVVLGQFKEGSDLQSVLLPELGVETLVRFGKMSWGDVREGDTAVLELREATPWTGQYRFDVISCSSLLGAGDDKLDEQDCRSDEGLNADAAQGA